MALKLGVNKKSLIQIALLVVLVAAAGGAYLLQQGGSLDFLTSMFGEEPPPPPKPAAPAPRRLAAERAAQAPAAPPAPAIPATPVKGKVHGKEFTLERAYVQNGVLVLLSGKGAADLGVSIHGLSKSWEVPAGRNLRLAPNAKGAELPRVRMSWRDTGQAAPESIEFADQYTLQLELGAEKDRKLPGKLHLALPDDGKSTLAGTFEAEVRGFRIVNGKPDLTSDAVDTLQYLALQDLLKADPARDVQAVSFHHERLSEPAAVMTGYLEVEYRVGAGAPPARARYQFVKDKGEWRVLRTLRLDQIDEAHPYQVPGAKDPPVRVFAYLAARRLEAELAKKAPKRAVYDAQFNARAAERHKLGQVAASYRLEGATRPATVTYLLRLKAKGWEIERALAAQERINFDTGKIEVAKAGK